MRILLLEEITGYNVGDEIFIKYGYFGLCVEITKINKDTIEWKTDYRTGTCKEEEIRNKVDKDFKLNRYFPSYKNGSQRRVPLKVFKGTEKAVLVGYLNEKSKLKEKSIWIPKRFLGFEQDAPIKGIKGIPEKWYDLGSPIFEQNKDWFYTYADYIHTAAKELEEAKAKEWALQLDSWTSKLRKTIENFVEKCIPEHTIQEFTLANDGKVYTLVLDNGSSFKISSTLTGFEFDDYKLYYSSDDSDIFYQRFDNIKTCLEIREKLNLDNEEIIKELKNRVSEYEKNGDHTYDRSDDHRVYKQGKFTAEEIGKIKKYLEERKL